MFIMKPNERYFAFEEELSHENFQNLTFKNVTQRGSLSQIALFYTCHRVGTSMLPLNQKSWTMTSVNSEELCN